MSCRCQNHLKMLWINLLLIHSEHAPVIPKKGMTKITDIVTFHKIVLYNNQEKGHFGLGSFLKEVAIWAE